MYKEQFIDNEIYHLLHVNNKYYTLKLNNYTHQNKLDVTLHHCDLTDLFVSVRVSSYKFFTQSKFSR